MTNRAPRKTATFSIRLSEMERYQLETMCRFLEVDAADVLRMGLESVFDGNDGDTLMTLRGNILRGLSEGHSKFMLFHVGKGDRKRDVIATVSLHKLKNKQTEPRADEPITRAVRELYTNLQAMMRVYEQKDQTFMLGTFDDTDALVHTDAFTVSAAR